jgi:addiction module HigA family antidote
MSTTVRTPGQYLVDKYLQPNNISVVAFAAAAGLSSRLISSIIAGTARVTPETAVRFETAVDSETTAQQWLEIQNAVDLPKARTAVGKSKRKPKALQ